MEKWIERIKDHYRENNDVIVSGHFAYKDICSLIIYIKSLESKLNKNETEQRFERLRKLEVGDGKE